MTLLLNKIFSSVAFSHFFVDMINSQRAILLAYLSVPLGLTNAMLGVISTLYSMIAAVAQPFFGFISDRKGPRWIVTGGVLWMGVFFTLAILVPGKIALVFLILASIGSGAVHPAGSAQATRLGKTLLEGQEATAASYFFLFGQFGYFLGPVVGGPLLDLWGPLGLILLVIWALPLGLFAGTQLQQVPVLQKVVSTEPVDANHRRLFKTGISASAIVALLVVAMCQSWAQQNVNVFLPKYLSDLGQSASQYGFLTALFMGGSGVGTLVGGMLADRIGKRRVILAGLAASSLPLLAMGQVGASAILYILVPLAGFLTGMAYTVIVVMAQRLIPGGAALASGLILGFIFSSGALGGLLTGYMADWLGLPLVFTMSAGLAVLGAISTYWLERV
ncbi:MAG: MFS transporter [Anaerolineaceae bacterium]